MKKFCLLAIMVLGVLFATSCKESPEFRFQLNLTGIVTNAPTEIAADFSINAANEAVSYFSLEQNAPVLAIESDIKANDWLNQYINDNVIANLEPETIYDFYVKGYVKEKVSGVQFSVDRRFTNKQE